MSNVPAGEVCFGKSAREQTMRLVMSAQEAMDELIRTLRARARRLKVLADGLYDRQTAAEVSAYAVELEAEAKRLEGRRSPLATRRLGITCH